MVKRSCTDCFHSDVCYAMGIWTERAETCTKYYATADVAEVVRCSKCKHLEIINKAPIYAKCKKHGIVFELWQEDTRENFCSFGAKMDGKVTE